MPDISFFSTMSGLSPRVRGNLADKMPVKAIIGSIPAGAGEPGPSTRYSTPWTVYPRGCGGTIPGFRFHFPEEGLSPRVRGNLVDESALTVVSRSIPAGAGEPP